LIADKGYHSCDRFRDLAESVWKTRVVEPKPVEGYLRWHGDVTAREAVYAIRTRLKSGGDRSAMRRCSKLVERCFAHVPDRDGIRRAWLRGRKNVHKRYLIMCRFQSRPADAGAVQYRGARAVARHQ
jgi:hypothetical protein